MTVDELVQQLRKIDPRLPLESVLNAFCTRCDGQSGMRLSVGGPQPMVTPPVPPEPKGVMHHADVEQIKGLPSNSDVLSWCYHDDDTVTLEVRQVVTVPIDLVQQLGALSPEEASRGKAIIEHLGTVIFQTMQSVGWHCGEVAACRKRGGPCAHRQA